MRGSKGLRGGRRESGSRGCWPPPPDRAGSTVTCGFAIITTQLCCLLWPVSRDHRPPHPRPESPVPNPTVLTFPSSPAVATTWQQQGSGKKPRISALEDVWVVREPSPQQGRTDRHSALQRKFPLNLFWLPATEQCHPRGRFLFGTYYLRSWPPEKVTEGGRS